MYSHGQLCERAKRWLGGTRRCDPVFSNCASCSEVPDAIGWSSCYKWSGSTVVECKTSLRDFYADKSKYESWHKPDGPSWMRYSRSRLTVKDAAEAGMVLTKLPSMGDYRFFFCEPGIITEEQVAERHPEHGLLWLNGRSVVIVRPAPLRTELIDKDSEIRYLRFAILNQHKPYSIPEECDFLAGRVV